ncbi:MAG: hypothetical protein WD894_21725 [Pirellulales bacterium]
MATGFDAFCHLAHLLSTRVRPKKTDRDRISAADIKAHRVPFAAAKSPQQVVRIKGRNYYRNSD